MDSPAPFSGEYKKIVSQERYRNFDIANNIFGSYRVNEFPFTLVLDRKDGLMKRSIEQVDGNTYVLPQNNNSFEDWEVIIKMTPKWVERL